MFQAGGSIVVVSLDADLIYFSNDFIFINRFGHVQHQGTLNKALRRIIRDYNVAAVARGIKDPNDLLPHFSCHVLRHSYATRCVECGVSVKFLQYQMGHSEYQLTMNYYVTPTQEFNFQEVKSFEKYIKSASSDTKTIDPPA